MIAPFAALVAEHAKCQPACALPAVQSEKVTIPSKMFLRRLTPRRRSVELGCMLDTPYFSAEKKIIQNRCNNWKLFSY